LCRPVQEVGRVRRHIDSYQYPFVHFRIPMLPQGC
jgi:hypothetical protein